MRGRRPLSLIRPGTVLLRGASAPSAALSAGAHILAPFRDADAAVRAGTLPCEPSCHSGLMNGPLRLARSPYLAVPDRSLTFAGIILPGPHARRRVHVCSDLVSQERRGHFK